MCIKLLPEVETVEEEEEESVILKLMMGLLAISKKASSGESLSMRS
jgi:hypothetical protein